MIKYYLSNGRSAQNNGVDKSAVDSPDGCSNDLDVYGAVGGHCHTPVLFVAALSGLHRHLALEAAFRFSARQITRVAVKKVRCGAWR